MVPLNPDWMSHVATVLMLVSVRILGFFLVMPLFAFRALPIRYRVVLSLVLAFGLTPLVTPASFSSMALAPGFLLSFIELAIGMAAGFMVRVGLVAVDLLALPAITVYGLFNMTQSILARVSPQMNLFSIGFSIMIPLAFVVIGFMLPAFPEIIQRALESPLRLLRLGLE